MTNYPNSIDNDLTIPIIDDNITEIGGEVINALRDAVITLEYVIGNNPQGTIGDLVSRLAVSINDDGTIKNSALSVPLITNSMVDIGAAIVESKLSLDYSTSTLNSYISNALSLISNLDNILATLSAQFSEHIYGIAFSDTYLNRHVASHIDINNGINNNYPLLKGRDKRDTSFYNTGLLSADGYTLRTSTNLMGTLIEMNNDLINHILSIPGTKHLANFISLNTTNFKSIPKYKNDVQSVIEYLDQFENNLLEIHRVEQHVSGIPIGSMVTSSTSDTNNTTYGPFQCSTSNTVYNTSTVTFVIPGNNSLDFAFRDLVDGDKITINYGYFSSTFVINSIDYISSFSYQVSIDGKHPLVASGLSAVLEKSHYEENKYGALAVVPANNNFLSAPNAADIPGSAIVIPPNAPSVTGMEMALDELNSTHYLLYIGFYQTGNPADIQLVETIDVTNNSGATPGKYTLYDIINNINNAFRSGSNNYRMTAFEYKGQLGLAIGDTSGNSGFSIISGELSGVTLITGAFTNNVIGDDRSDFKDVFGFGASKANVASPYYNSGNSLPTKVFLGKKSRNYDINGQYIDYLADGYATTDGYYIATLISSNVLGATRTQSTYRVYQDLSNSKLYKGSTIVVGSHGSLSYPLELYFGRFFVENITYAICPGSLYTDITTVSSNFDPTAVIGSVVRIYFSDDSVSFDTNVSGNYRRYFETFVKRDGQTFTHKRAQFELVTGDSQKLQTNLGASDLSTNYGWHILDVSPKLKGFGSGNSKNVRFYIYNYNSSDDSFDGYLGDLETLSINNGPITRCKKDKVCRLYDYTGIDYIDILFQDNSAAPYTITCPANESRYVDIQIFDSIRLDQNYMCLSSCEQYILGGPKAVVAFFNDKREFGSVSEKIISTSGINFIDASDRLFRQNGVHLGFDVLITGSTYISFNGGTAVINGKIVNKNNFTANIYTLYDPAILPTLSFIDFVLCINDNGNYELIPLNSTSTTKLYNTGYTRVYTLNELLETRKDLLPIYIIQTSASNVFFNIGGVLDIRYYINDSEEKMPVVVSGRNMINSDSSITSTTIGNFETLTAASNYIKYSNNIHSTIKIKGTLTINTAIDFGSSNVSIIGEKSNSVICTVSNSPSLYLNSNMEIDGVNFVRQFGPDSAVAPYGPTGYGLATLGLIIGDDVVSYKNITIKNCSFSSTYRKPHIAHILFEQTGDGAILSNINIINNTFNETKAQLCIAFVNKEGAILTQTTTFNNSKGTILNDVNIENNKGNFCSYIMLSSDNYSTNKTRGLSAYNVKITKNTFDYVWLNLSRSVLDGYDMYAFEYYDNSYPSFRPNVIIFENSFNGISAKAINGTDLSNTTSNNVSVASPDICIHGNNLASVSVCCNSNIYLQNTKNIGMGNVSISNNIFNCSVYSAYNFSPSDSPIANYLSLAYNNGNAINIASNYNNVTVGPGSSDDHTHVAFVNNNIFVNKYKSTAQASINLISPPYPAYNIVIYSEISCVISNNIIEGCIYTDGFGVKLSFDNATLVYKSVISNNVISRLITNITAYIYIGGTDAIEQIKITDNKFDSPYVDIANTNTNVINTTDASNKYKIISQRNVNESFVIDLQPYVTQCLEGVYVESPNPSVYSSGWVKINRLSVSGVTETIDSRFMPNLLLKNSNFATSSTICVGPFMVNVPYIDGAKIQTITFSLLAARSPAVANISIKANSADLITDTDSFTVTLNSAQYTVTPSSISDSSIIPTSISIDVSSLTITYDTTISNSRTVPVIISLIDSATSKPLNFVKTGDPPTDVSIYIKNIKGTFIY